MAKNDVILLDGIIDERVEINLPSSRRDEAFEYLSFEQILKDSDLSKEEIDIGSIDGRNDGGIDGFFTLINGHLLSDTENFTWPKTGSQIEVWIITCKHHETFKQAPLDNLAASLIELFDFSLNSSELKADYSEEVLKCKEDLKFAYRKLSARLSIFSINFAYASRGDTSDIGESIISRSEQIKSIALDSFGKCQSEFYFFGATELVELYRKAPTFALELPFSDVLSRGERYVVLANLTDYYNFITDPETGKLKRYLFDSNVRDFMGLNRVNEDIKTTLENNSSPDFWLLNNGVTILSTVASVTGKTLQLQDIQIVNGLQTTESIYRHFSSGGSDDKNRSVLIKVIVSSEEATRDAIIAATNNQTNVELASLHATDKIQRDIEDILVRNGLYYERRKNYYANLGYSTFDIITPLYLASGYVSLILKSPHKAATLRSRFMRTESYDTVFSPKTPIKVWPKIAKVLQRTDIVLESLRPTGKFATERFLKKWRQVTSFLAVSKIYGKFNFTANDLSNLNESELTNDLLQNIWSFISLHINSLSTNSDWQNKKFLIELYTQASKDYEITGIESFIKREIIIDDYKKNRSFGRVDMNFALRLNKILPEQPWKPGVHKEMMRQMQCSKTSIIKP